jgi:uncharacterized protein YndB with AHSA1/START domain
MTTFQTSREIAATAAEVFAAFSDAKRLARWWGPAGFTNTFSTCEFREGGAWSFVMHGPDGHGYPNESRFVEIKPVQRVVIQHVNAPRFVLTVNLAASATGTVVSWSQAFESAEVAAQVKHVVVPANEQNLDRLTAEVLSARGCA